MAVSIDLVYKTVSDLINSNSRGNVTPTELRLFINDSVNEIYEEYFYEVNRLLNRENRGLMNGGLENLPDRIREKIQHFSKTADLTYADPVFTLPADIRYIDTITYNGTANVEMCANSREFKTISGFSHTRPTVQNPIGLQQGNSIKIEPAAIVDNVTIDYLRNPLLANWTFVVVGNAEIFNPSASDFADIDLHSSEFNNVVVRTAKRFGINLKEQEITAAANNEQNADFNSENQS